MNAVFDQEHYQLLNRARGGVVRSLLRELQKPLRLKTAIDVGCGLGYFSHVLQSQGLEVLSVDGRQQNLDEAQARNPDIRFMRFDAQDQGMISLGAFDLVFCFGLLYHLENPMLAIRNLKQMTQKVLFVEGVVCPGSEPKMILVEEDPYEDQGLNLIAFYPTESCLLKMLFRAGFSHAYTLAVQPEHPDYLALGSKPRIRTMLVATHNAIQSKLLLPATEPKSAVHPCTLGRVPAQFNVVEKIKRFVEKPLPQKVGVIKRIVTGKPVR